MRLTPHVRTFVLGALAALAVAGPAAADTKADGSLRDDVASRHLEVRLRTTDVTFDATRLGHAVLPVRATLTNRGPAPLLLDPKGFRFLARGNHSTYACDSHAAADRWPTHLDPGESFHAERVAICETTLPGPHDLEARWVGAPDADPPVATTQFTIEPGATPPVPLSSRPELLATVTGTREARPSDQPGKIRIVLSLVNGSETMTTLSPIVVDIELRQRGKTFACRDRRTVELSGLLAPGRAHFVWMPLTCAVPYEGFWEATVEIGEPKTPLVKLQRHVLRVQEIEPWTPR